MTSSLKSKLPCENCICLAICKAKTNNHDLLNTSIELSIHCKIYYQCFIDAEILVWDEINRIFKRKK